MRKSPSPHTVHVLAASGLLAIACSASATPPTSFDQWTTSGANINASCPSGFTCEINVQDAGITQQILTDGNGNRYIQQIIAGTDAKGSISTESFVNASSQALSGISVKQQLFSSGADGMDSTVAINTGWANTAGSPAFQVQQALTSVTPDGTSYTSGFNFSQNRDAANKITGHYMDIREDLIDSTLQSTGTTATGSDIQSFVMRRASGNMVPRSGSVSLPGSGGGGMMGGGGGPSGGTMAWAAGDDIQVLWIGQLCEGCQQSGTGGTGGTGGMGGMGSMGGSGSGTFSFQAYDNLSDSAAGIATRSLFTTSPTNWVDPFGTQPALAQ